MSPPPAPLHPHELDAQSSESLLRLIADSVPALLAYYDLPSMRCVFANEGYAAYNGHTATSILGKTVREAIGEPAWELIRPHVERVMQGESVKYTRQQTLPDGEVRVIEVSLTPHMGLAQGRPGQLGSFVLINDITHHWQSEQAVRQSEERMRKFSLATDEAIVFHRQGLVVDFNEALTRLLGYTLDEARGRPTLSFLSDEYRSAAEEYIREGREDPYEATVRHKDGRPVPVEIVGKTMPTPQGTYRIAVLRDISVRKQAQERMEFLALHDSLTHLPNRRHLMDRMADALSAAQRKRARAALLFIDLDHFKTVNDSLGHEAGDLLLCEVARRLTTSVRGSDLLARVGGDQFVVVLPDIHNRADAATVADKLLQDVRAVFHVQG
ncbi:MAG: diguanylate cyclase, partial [Comamonadaceae bacterium]